MAFAFQQVSVQNPDAGVGIRVKREVRSAAEIADNLRDAVLEMWTGFNLAWSATGVLPGILQQKRARVRIARDGRSACRDNVWRSAGPHSARAVSGRRNVDNAGSGEGSVEESFLGEFPATPTHGDFAASVCGDKIRRYRHRLEQIAETLVFASTRKILAFGAMA